MPSTTRKAYLTDLTDEQWAILAPLIPPAKGGGRPREVDMREVIGADNKYQHHALNAWIVTKSPGQWPLDIVRRPAGTKGFGLLPKRGVVERPFAWLGRCRRHSRDYERRTDSSESMLRVSAIHLMLKRLKPSHVYPPFQYRAAA
jgi:putative transposase